MLAIELVKDPATKEPDPELTAKIFEETRWQGLIVCKPGPHRSVLRRVSPLRLSKDDLDSEKCDERQYPSVHCTIDTRWSSPLALTGNTPRNSAWAILFLTIWSNKFIIPTEIRHRGHLIRENSWNRVANSTTLSP